MNTLSRPDVIILLRCTVLLALGWAAHWLLRARHPRWRVILWRGLLCACATVPLMQFTPFPMIRIPVFSAAIAPAENIEVRSPVTTVTAQPAKENPIIQPASTPISATGSLKSLNSTVNRSTPIHWTFWVLLAWGIGSAFAALRLMRLQFQLSQLKNRSRLADPAMREQAQVIQTKLRVRRPVAIRISDLVSSSFLCGLVNPAILLPEKLVHDLSREEVSALLAHEIAHVRRYDLFWCVAWQWARALLWFHPLVWKIPAAHNLACEQEADRLASGQLEDGGIYRQVLARLALRILALPEVETRLALNANSQIAQRLNQLGRGTRGEWSWKHSIAGIAMVGALLLAVTGFEFSQAVAANPTPKFEFKTVQVIVLDDEGKPIQGATVKPDGFRVKGIHGADAYGWRKDFGLAETVTTDADGKASLKYPVMSIPEEKEYTGALIFNVLHPDFSTVRIQSFSIDGTDNPIRMTRGISFEVSGYFGTDHQPVTDIVPFLGQEGLHASDWIKEPNGVMAYHKLSPGGHMVQLMGRLPSGDMVYSDAFFFTAEKGKASQYQLEMKPGIRLEGRLDAAVPRPIRNGRAMINVRPKEYPALNIIEDYYQLDDKYGPRYMWHSYRPIAEDGSFVFESIPPGEVDVTVLGDGFVSKSIGELHNRVDGNVVKGPDMGIPQAFPLVAPVTSIEVVTEPPVTLQLTTTTKSGKPIEGVFAGIYPSAFRMKGKFGWMTNSSEEPYREMPQLPDLVISGKTDNHGTLVLSNLPAEVHGLDIDHSEYQPQLQQLSTFRDRYIRVKWTPGETNVLNLVLEPKGTSFIGTAE